MKKSKTDMLNFGDVTSETGCISLSCCKHFFLLFTPFHALMIHKLNFHSIDPHMITNSTNNDLSSFALMLSF